MAEYGVGYRSWRVSVADPRVGRVVERATATFKPRRRGLSPKRQAEFEDWPREGGLAETGPEAMKAIHDQTRQDQETNKHQEKGAA